MAFKFIPAHCIKCGKRSLVAREEQVSRCLCFDCGLEQKKLDQIDRDAEQFLLRRKKGK